MKTRNKYLATRNKYSETSNKYLRKQISKVFIILAVASLGVACEKDSAIIDEISDGLTDGLVTITAATEEGATTRTSLGVESPTKSVLWTALDKIKVYSATSSAGVEFTLSTGGGSASGTFTGGAVSGQKVAIYPSSIATGLSGDGATLSFTLPSTQTYKADGFAEGVFPMVAFTNGDNFPFKNLCGIIKLSLTGTEKVTQIVITSTEVLSGAATVDLTKTEEYSNPKILMATEAAGGSKSVSLDCSAGGGVQLDAGTAVDFYIVVPPTVNLGGFTAEIASVAGLMTKTAVTTSSAVARSMETRMAAFAYTATDATDYATSNMAPTFIVGRWWAPVNAGYDANTAEEGLLYIGKSNGSDGEIGLNPDATGVAQKTPTLGANYACPEGWEPPTIEVYEALIDAGSKWIKAGGETPNNIVGSWFGSDASTATVSNPGNAIFFSATPWWDATRVSLTSKGVAGHYWSSSWSGSSQTRHLRFSGGEVDAPAHNTSNYGFSVRCVKKVP